MSEGISTGKQQTDMATLHSQQTSKDQGIKENNKEIETKEIFQ